MERALQTLVPQLRKQKFAATDRPRVGQRRATAGKRHIPAHVRRAVWARDGGQCTFVSEAGHRCEARKGLEYDHIEPFARGGEATVAGVRLRCRAHNQYEAERVYGAGFMREKREAAQRAAADRRAAARAEANEVIPWLRGLGFRAEEARAAAALCEDIPDAPLEQRVRVALSYFNRKRPSCGARPTAGSPTAAV
jgi:5-methylcytosine-specific restriction endonuclease McrA